MVVNRCVCADISFVQLHELASVRKLTLKELSAETECCRGCGLCGKYVRLMLLTSQTEFRLMTQEELDRQLNLVLS